MTDEWERARLDHRTHQAQAIAGAALSLLLEQGAPALTMAAIAEASGVSRPTLYRYYGDIDAVLAGIADLVTAHDDEFEAQVRAHDHPADQLDLIVRTVSQADGHDGPATSGLEATLPPAARETLARHQDRIAGVLAGVLRSGVAAGAFRGEVDPEVDAPLILGLAAASPPADPTRALTLVHRLVDPDPKEHPR